MPISGTGTGPFTVTGTETTLAIYNAVVAANAANATTNQAEHDATQVSLSTLPAGVLAATVETGFSLAREVRVIAAAVAGRTAGGPGSFVARNLSDTADQISGAADANGNRSPPTYGA